MPRLTLFLLRKECFTYRTISEVLPTSLSPITKILKLAFANRLKATEDLVFMKLYKIRVALRDRIIIIYLNYPQLKGRSLFFVILFDKTLFFYYKSHLDDTLTKD